MIKKLAIELTLIVFVFFYIPLSVSAETVVRSGESVTVAADQIVEGDFYAVGDNVVMSGETIGDLTAVARTVTINGVIEGDVTLAVGTAQLHAPIADDVRIVGGNITIANSVGGDVFVFGGRLSVLSTATIGGDIFFFGGESDISGTVTGSISGKVNKIRINTDVGGDVDVSTKEGLRLGDRTTIQGDVRYTSDVPIARSQNAVVEGEVVENSVLIDHKQEFKILLFKVLILLFASLTFLLIGKKRLHEFVEETISSSGILGLMGLGFVLLMPLVSVLLMVTILGLLIGILFMFGYIFILLFAYVLTGIVTGAFFSKLITKRIQVNLLWTIIGTIFIQIMLFIPIVGPIVVIFVLLVVLGGLIKSLYRFLS